MPKVLIADDSLKVQKELTELLKESGVEVVAVSNGEHAVRRLPNIQPDLVLADIFMPVRSGYEVCEFIKNTDEFAHVSVLLLASKMEPYDEAEAKRVGADGKLEKPFADPSAVLAALQSHLDKAAAPAPKSEPSAAPAQAAAVPSAPEPEPEPEPQEFSIRPPPFSFDESSPMGFADVEDAEEERATSSTAPAESLPEASQAPASESAEVNPSSLEPPVEEPPAAQEPARPVAGFEPSPETPKSEETTIEKPDLAAPWEMTGPEPNAPEIPSAGGWDSQWAGADAEEVVNEAPAEEEEAEVAQPATPEEFGAAFEGVSTELPPTQPIERERTEPPAAEAAPPEPPAAEPAPAEPTPLEARVAEEVAATAWREGAQEIDPAMVDRVVNQVVERLSPQVMETIAREIVRPLAEALLKERPPK